MFLGLLVTSVYFIRVEPLVLTRINQTERITLECKTAGPALPIMPCKEIAELAWWARMIISYLVAGTMLSILRLYGCYDLMDRLKKIEARVESLALNERREAEWQRLSDGVTKLETQIAQFFEK
jgi:hypothetical protein